MTNLKIFFIFFSIIFFGGRASGQYWMQSGGSATIDEAMSVASDATGNSYTTGYFTSTANIDGNSFSSTGLDDIFLVKTNSTGGIDWVKTAGGLNSDKALSVATDNAGNIAITGFFYSSADFDGQSITSAGQQDVFIAKYNSSGTLLWVTSAGGTGSDAGNSIAFDNAGNVIVTGEFTGTCSFGSISLTSFANSLDVFTAKYDAGGNVLWAKKGSARYTDRGTGVSTDATGNIFVCGMFSDTITFDNVHNNAMYNAMFVIKYDGAGNEQWFRWMGSGSTVNMGGVAVHGNDINLTGNFTGTLFFFGNASNPTLATANANNIFVCRYDELGNVSWAHADGSSSDITSQAIAVQSNGEVLITGNFKCRFDDFSAHYGTGIFCSVGYWDSFIAGYDNAGAWKWARHYGGKADDFTNGIAVLSNDNAITAGSYEDELYSTYSFAGFTFHGIYYQDYYNFSSTYVYCTDASYGAYVVRKSYGNKDIFINANINLARQPLDYFKRSGANCLRPFSDICIQAQGVCDDTLSGCGIVDAGVEFGYDPFGPDMNYLWSNGSTNDVINITTSGNYSVMVTTADGCFTNGDTVNGQVHPVPPEPTISDSKGVNTNAVFTSLISFCLPDSVALTCTNVGANTVHWNNFPVGQNPVIVSSTGYYSCMLTNQWGCSEINSVDVVASNPFQAVQPEMTCLTDDDQNDTVELCLGDPFVMLVYDEFTNPGGNDPWACFPDMSYATWSSTNSNFLAFSAQTYCPTDRAANEFTPTQVGDFDFLISVFFVRENDCDTDTVTANKNIHVIVHPVPTVGPINITITGPAYICFGDTVMLVASPSQYDYQWNTGDTNDTIFITQTGYYQVSASESVTNAFGCTGTSYGNANIFIDSYPQPVVSMLPANGLICPNDSVELICSGIGGAFNWQGPNGTLNSTAANVYVSTPGFYYCIQNVSTNCSLVSNTVEVVQYNIPLIIASPNANICNGDSVVLIISTNPGSVIQWLAPLSGNASSQTIFTPGTYSCVVTSCNIMTPLSFTVGVDSAAAHIYSDNTSFTFCEGDSILLYSNPGMTQYEWLPTAQFEDSIYAFNGGPYMLVTTSAGGCTDTATLVLDEILNTLVAPQSPDTMICRGSSVLLIAAGSDTIYWASSPSYSNTVATGYSFLTPALFSQVSYYLYSNSGMCKSIIDSVTVSIDEGCDSITIPNVITPNGDGLNDFFPGVPGNYAFDLIVYNRWGEKVYDASALQTGWNGKNKRGVHLSDGTYYYLLHIIFDDGAIQDFKGYLLILE